MAMRNREDDGMITKVVSINRVSKTVKGGRTLFSLFFALSEAASEALAVTFHMNEEGFIMSRAFLPVDYVRNVNGYAAPLKYFLYFRFIIKKNFSFNCLVDSVTEKIQHKLFGCIVSPVKKKCSDDSLHSVGKY